MPFEIKMYNLSYNAHMADVYLINIKDQIIPLVVEIGNEDAPGYVKERQLELYMLCVSKESQSYVLGLLVLPDGIRALIHEYESLPAEPKGNIIRFKLSSKFVLNSVEVMKRLGRLIYGFVMKFGKVI